MTRACTIDARLHSRRRCQLPLSLAHCALRLSLLLSTHMVLQVKARRDALTAMLSGWIDLLSRARRDVAETKLARSASTVLTPALFASSRSIHSSPLHSTPFACSATESRSCNPQSFEPTLLPRAHSNLLLSHWRRSFTVCRHGLLWHRSHRGDGEEQERIIRSRSHLHTQPQQTQCETHASMRRRLMMLRASKHTSTAKARI